MNISKNKLNKLIILCDLATTLYELKPWNFLSDLDFIQILNPDIEPSLVLVLGSSKIYEGFNIGVGIDDTTAFLGNLSADKKESNFSRLRYHRNFTINYDKFDNLFKEEQDIIKACYNTISNSKIYPSFYRNDYGFFPRFLLLKEIEILIKICKRLIAIINDVSTLPIKPDCDKGLYLINLYSEKSKKYETYVGPPFFDLFFNTPDFSLPHPQLPKNKTNNLTVEIDTIFLPFNIANQKTMPILSFLVDQKSGMVIHKKIEYLKTNREEEFAKFYLEVIEKFGYFKRVYCRSLLDQEILFNNFKENDYSKIEIKHLKWIDNFIDALMNREKEDITSEYIN